MMKGKLSVFLLILSLTAAGQKTIDELYPPKFASEIQEPEKIIQTGEGSWFVDFGRDAFGTLMFHLPVERADTIVVRLGEKLTSPSKIDSNPGGTIRFREIRMGIDPHMEYYIIDLPADKRNTNPPAISLPDSFGVIMPFRYCEIDNYPGDLKKNNISRKIFHYSFNEEASGFTSSDTILNHIWDLCKYSIKATSFTGYYIDGDRERIPYEGDALINQLSQYSVDNEYTLARRTNEYFMRNPTWPAEWILHTVILFYYDYLYTGDLEAITRHYEALKAKTLIALAREDGLISSASPLVNDDLMRSLGFRDTKQRIRDIVDWPPAQKDTGWKLATAEGERDGYEMVPVNTVVNSFHYYNLVLMSHMADWLGKSDDAEWYSNRALIVRESINNKLFDATKGIYVDGEGSSHSSLHANMFPLAFGLVAEKDRSTVVKFIKSRGMACSVYGSQYLLDGLFNAGEADYAKSLLTSLSDRSWWNMIRSGSTITLEAWDMKYKPNSDWNHAWGAAPANIITRQLWGIKPAEPGFKKAEIRPQMADLTSSSIVVPTINGQISAGYEKITGKTVLFTFDIPRGMTAEFRFSDDEISKAVVNGKKMRTGGKPLIMKPGKNIVELIKK